MKRPGWSDHPKGLVETLKTRVRVSHLARKCEYVRACVSVNACVRVNVCVGECEQMCVCVHVNARESEGEREMECLHVRWQFCLLLLRFSSSFYSPPPRIPRRWFEGSATFVRIEPEETESSQANVTTVRT